MNILYAAMDGFFNLPAGEGQNSAVVPKYRTLPRVYSDKMKYIMHFFMNIGWRSQYCGIFKTVTGGGTVYFIENEYYFGEGCTVHGGEAFEDERNSYFARAVLEMLPKIGIKPDIIHALDMRSAKICSMLETHYKKSGYYGDIKSFVTVRNIKPCKPDFFYFPENVQFWQSGTYSDISCEEYEKIYERILEA